MRQTLGPAVPVVSAVAGDSAAPTANEGVALSAFSGSDARKVTKWLLTVTVGGTGTIVASIYGRPAGGAWGIAGPNDGKINGGTALAAGNVYHFPLENLGIFDRVTVRTTGATGAPETSAELREIIEYRGEG